MESKFVTRPGESFESMVVDDRLIALSVREGQVLLLFKKQAPAHLQPGAHDLQIWLTDQNEGVKVAARLKLLS